MLASEWHVGQVFLSLLWFALFVIWVWLLIGVLVHVFTSPDLSGLAKALWFLFVVVLPYLGVFVYIITRGSRMHSLHVGLPGPVPASEPRSVLTRAQVDTLARLNEERDQGLIDAEAYRTGREQILA
jgi:hypothetical protein